MRHYVLELDNSTFLVPRPCCAASEVHLSCLSIVFKPHVMKYGKNAHAITHLVGEAFVTAQ